MSIGHNTLAGGQLKAIIERVEHLEEEKKEIAEQVKEVYAEAKANGYSTKILRQVVKMRKMDAEQRQEDEAMLDIYWRALHGSDDMDEEGEDDAG